ncbi:uncharacterized mitochondrial protein-like protein [Tanacetum coccineum]
MGFKEEKLTRPYSSKGTKMSSIGELTFFLGLQVQQKKDGIFISQDKYVDEILKKFGFTEVKIASTPIETQKPLLKDENGEEVDVHMYRSMIGSLMYLTSSRPDIMFAVCACARYQVNPKVSHLYAVKRIFRYLKGQPKLGLWYSKDSPFDLVAYTDSDYAGASLDRKSTIGGCQFLGCRLISWQCKKQTVVANSTTEAQYVAASSCRGQVLWIQNQLLNYGYNFMHTKIFIDNNRKAKRSVRLMMEKLIGMEFELMLIVDFLNAHPVRYALTVNPTIYVSCIELDTHNMVAFLSKPAEKGSTKTTAWNEFSSTMASAIICLATNQKFNFSKYIFESMVKNLENMSGKSLMYPRELTRIDTKIPQSSGPTKHVADEAVYKERGDSLVRAATIASSLEVEQDSGNIDKTQSKATLNEPSSSGTSSSNGPRRQETMGDTISQTRFENVSKLSNDPLLARDMFGVHDLVSDEVVVESEVVVKADEKRNVVEEVVVVIDAASTIPDKGKEIMIEEPVVEQVKPMKRLKQMRLDGELAFKLQAKEEEEERLAREKAQQIEEANIA